MAVLVFVDGPAAGQRVENVEPTDVRWLCEMFDGEKRLALWWVFDGEPEPEENVRVTKYRVISIRADNGAPEGDPNPTIHTYAAEPGGP